MGLSSSVGNASSYLYGIQAKRVSFNSSYAEVSGPQSGKPGLFSGEPVSFFTGVVAGTNKRRWLSVGGKGKAAQGMFWPRCFGQCVWFFWHELVGYCAVWCGPCGLARLIRTVRSPRSCMVKTLLAVTCSRCCVLVRMRWAARSLWFLGSLPIVLLARLAVWQVLVLGDVVVLLNDVSLGFQRLLHHHRGCGSRAVRAAQRAEAGSDSCHSFASSFERCESHIARSHRVNVILHENLLDTSSGCRTACTTHNSPACETGVHDALQRVIRLGRNSGNSFNSWGDTEEGGLHFCVPG